MADRFRILFFHLLWHITQNKTLATDGNGNVLFVWVRVPHVINVTPLSNITSVNQCVLFLLKDKE